MRKIFRNTIILALFLAFVFGAGSVKAETFKKYPCNISRTKYTTFPSDYFVKKYGLSEKVGESAMRAYLAHNPLKKTQTIYLFWEESSGENKVSISGIYRSANGNVKIEIDRDVPDNDTPEYVYYVYMINLNSYDFKDTDNVKIVVNTTTHYSDGSTHYDENGNPDTNTTEDIDLVKKEDPAYYNLKFKVLKQKQTITVKTSKKTVKYSKIKKKAKTLSVIKVKNAVGTVKYKLVKPSKKIKKAIKVNAKTGKITVKKGEKKGKYKPKVQLTVTDAHFETYTRTVTLNITVK